MTGLAISVIVFAFALVGGFYVTFGFPQEPSADTPPPPKPLEDVPEFMEVSGSHFKRYLAKYRFRGVDAEAFRLRGEMPKVGWYFHKREAWDDEPEWVEFRRAPDGRYLTKDGKEWHPRNPLLDIAARTTRQVYAADLWAEEAE